jgi:Uma2 family endonuclease
MTQAKPRFRTLEEYVSYADGTDQRYELVHGELIELPTESDLNVMIAGFLFVALLPFVPHYLIRRGTELEVNSRSVSCRCPDLMVLSEETLAALAGARRSLVVLEMPAPRLVVEMVSPGEPGTENHDRDYIEKPKEYAARGIPEYWLVDPARQMVIVLFLDGQDYREVRRFKGSDRVVSPTFPGLPLTAEAILRAGQ